MFLIAYVGTAILITLFVMGVAAKLAKEKGKNPVKWAGLSFLALFALVFWDYYPTQWAHQYYCEKEAGFWVYKTLEQWKAENPGVIERLVENNSSPEGVSPNWPMEDWAGKKIASINQRFGMLYKNHLSNSDEGELLVHVWRWEIALVDKKTSEVLARQVDFSAGNGFIGGEPPLRFWLQKDHCTQSAEQVTKFGNFINQFKGERK
jgi:hypothetical protein